MAEQTITTFIPALYYRDPRKALDWLAKAFGFEEQLVVTNDDGVIVHSEMRFGGGFIMVAGPGGEDFRQKSPLDVGGASTAGTCVYVRDVDAHYARAKAAGAQVVRAIEDAPYGARLYSVRDLEGHVWTFGNYQPGKHTGDIKESE
jgi:uncharacterized glyoxalase superfamily protein PhnB